MKTPRVLIVTGTDTGVGKTVVTAALASVYAARGSVAVYKPAQTGVGPTDAGDINEVARLSGVDTVFEGCRLRDPLAPTSAARREGVTPSSVTEHAQVIDKLAATYDTVLVEGAGGVLVGLDSQGRGLLELADNLSTTAGFVVVVRAGLGTLNHARLTVEAIGHKGRSVLGIVIGSDPAHPGLAESCNLTDLPAVTGTAMLGRVREDAAALRPNEFQRQASGWFSMWPEL